MANKELDIKTLEGEFWDVACGIRGAEHVEAENGP